MISIIVGVADNGVIGKKGGSMPWNQRDDLKHFRAITMGHPVIMGSNTYRTIGHPLNGRTTFVVTNDSTLEANGCTIVDNLPDAFIQASQVEGGEEVFVMGGGSIYKQSLPYTDKIYLTEIHGSPDGDVMFEFDKSQWKEVSREHFEADENNDFAYDYVEYIRNKEFK